MARSPNRRLYRQIPRGRFPVKTCFWLCALAIGLAGLGSVTAKAIAHSTLTSSHDFIGRMSSKIQPVSIAAPQGAIVQEVLVASGESVRRGQTIASYDKDAITRKLKDLEQLNRHGTVT